MIGMARSLQNVIAPIWYVRRTWTSWASANATYDDTEPSNANANPKNIAIGTVPNTMTFAPIAVAENPPNAIESGGKTANWAESVVRATAFQPKMPSVATRNNRRSGTSR